MNVITIKKRKETRTTMVGTRYIIHKVGCLKSTERAYKHRQHLCIKTKHIQQQQYVWCKYHIIDVAFGKLLCGAGGGIRLFRRLCLEAFPLLR